jgi:hypothetical protein
LCTPVLRSQPDKRSDNSSNFTNYYILGNIFFGQKSTMYIGCIPEKELIHSAKGILVNQQDPVGESIITGIVLCPFYIVSSSLTIDKPYNVSLVCMLPD